MTNVPTLDILFSSNHNIHKSFQLKGLKPENKGHTNFYECCDLTKKVYLTYLYNIGMRE